MPKTNRKKRTELWKDARVHRDKWRKSGQSRLEYAEKAGLAPSTFSRWVRKLEAEESDRAGETIEAKAEVAGRREVVRVPPSRPGLLAVRVVPSLVIDGHEGPARARGLKDGTGLPSREHPVEIDLPGGVRIRYPAGVSPPELFALVSLLEGRC